MKSCEIFDGSGCAQFNPTHITINEIIEKYVPAGFHYFKLEGRTWSSNEMAVTLAEYLIKPEYQGYFLTKMLKNMK